MFELFAKWIKQSPIVATVVALAGALGFVISVALASIQLIDVFDKHSTYPKVHISIHAADPRSYSVNVPVNVIKRIPKSFIKDDNGPVFEWKAIPIRATFINPRSEPTSFLNLQLMMYKNGEQIEVNGGKPEEKNATWITYIKHENTVNPNCVYNEPITIEANGSRLLELDFISWPLVEDFKEDIEKLNSIKFCAFSLRWTDQDGNKYMSNIYRTDAWIRSSSNKANSADAKSRAAD